MPIYKTDEKKNGVYKYKVRVNYVDANGKGRQLTRVVWGSAEAKELERQLTDEVNNKQLSNSSLTVQQLFVDFFKSIKHTTRATTIQGYEKNYRLHIKPYIDNVQLKRLNTKNLTDWKNQVNEKGLSLVTRKNIYATLRAALNFAVKMDMLPVSPLDKVDNFKDSYYQAQEIDFYTPEEFQLYKSAALDNAKKIDYYDYYIFFCLAYYTGARKGEIHALRWNRLDGKTLSIKSHSHRRDISDG